MTRFETPIDERTSFCATLGLVNQAILRAQSREELFSQVCRIVVESGHFNMAGIDWLDTASNLLVPAAKAGEISATPCAAFPFHLHNQLCGVLTAGAIEPGSWNGTEAAFLKDVALNLSFALDKIAPEHHRREVEDALNEGQQLLQSVLQSGLDGFYLVDTRGRFLQVNDAYCAMSGYSRDELLQMCVAEVEASENAQDVAAHMQNIISRGMDRFESRHRRKDGQVLDIETSVNFQDYDGGRFFCFLRDVTERKQAERALRRSEEHFRSLFENMAEGYAHCKMLFDDRGHPEDFIYLDVNNAFTRLTGLDGVIGRKITELIPGFRESQQELLETYGRVSLTGRPESFEVEVAPLAMWFYVSVYSPEKEHFVAVFDVITERKRAEQALRESEERYRRLFANNPHPMWVFDVETLSFLEVNGAAVAHYGYSRQEFLSMTIDEIRSPEDVPALLKAISTNKNGYSFNSSARHRKKDGTLIDVEIADYRFLQDGRLVSLILANDITERRRAEDAVRRSEAELRSFVEKSPFGIFRTHVEHDRFLDVNPALVKMLGYGSAEEVYSLKLSTDVYIDMQEREKTLTPLLRDGVNRIEIQCRQKNGELVNLHLSGRLAADSVHGGQVFEGIASDVTERKQAEQALRESEERFRQVVEGAPTGMYIQTDGLFRYLNPAAVAIFGASSAGQIVGQSYLERIHPDSHAAVCDRARLVTEEKLAVPFLEERLLRLDGTVFDAEVTAMPFVFKKRSGVLVFLRDITGRKREEREKRALEQQLRQAQKMEAVGRLAGGIAHDFNNLLMVIQSYTEMLQDGLPAGDSLRNDTEQVLKAARRATSLTGQMLAFSRKQIINPVLLDLNAVIGETASMVKRLIGEDIEIRLDLAESPWAVEADSDQIVQVLMNLCVNSRDAMPEGGTLSIATENIRIEQGGIPGRSYVAPGEYVKLSVTDTGMGISKQAQERIFEPFYTTKEVGKGTGLGLAMVYGIVKQNGGYLWVESEPNQGACFIICLPRATGAICSLTPAKTDAQPRGTETLLVAEDEEALRMAVCGYLRTLGYTVLEASSGEQAIAAAGQHPGHIDLLVTDVVMPKMSGREISQMLGCQRSGLKTIYMSGYTDDAVLRHGIHKLGATFLQKPFSLGTLARKVRDTLESKAGN